MTPYSLQDDLSIGRPEMTNWNLGASEVQATHQRNIGSDEIRIGGLPQHLIILFTKPPREMNIRCEGVKVIRRLLSARLRLCQSEL